MQIYYLKDKIRYPFLTFKQMANHFKVGLEELEVDGYFTIDKHNLLYRYQVSYNHQNLTTIYCSAKMDLKGYLNVENNYYKY